MIDFKLLKDELINDPLELGYKSTVDSKDDSLTAEIINTPNPKIIIQRNDITKQEFSDAISLFDIDTNATLVQIIYFLSLAVRDSIKISNDDGSQTELIKSLSTFISGNSLVRLQNLSTKVGSRAEQLFGVNVSFIDIGKALRG